MDNETWAAQLMLCHLTGSPARLAEPAFSALYRQCWDARYGHDDGMNYDTVPF